MGLYEGLYRGLLQRLVKRDARSSDCGSYQFLYICSAPAPFPVSFQYCEGGVVEIPIPMINKGILVTPTPKIRTL